MISKIKLVSFRNFQHFTQEDLREKNFIIGHNGQGKTNILEALSLLGNNSLSKLDFDNLVGNSEGYFFIEVQDENNDRYSLSYEKETKKKKYSINGKTTTKKIFSQKSYKCINFSPIVMNMMYLSPSLRRDFLDEILKSSFDEYSSLLKEYKKILLTRNKLLKNISEGSSQESELNFWDNQFIELANRLYQYRFKVIDFLSGSIDNCLNYFGGKVKSIEIKYQCKVNQQHIYEDIKNYLAKNRQRDIIIGKTAIGIHVDDFQIYVDDKELTTYASRGEVKSVIIWLKLLEAVFVEKMNNKKPIILIDDLLSELDQEHKDLLLDKIKYYQVFITSIEKMNYDGIYKKINI